MVLNSALLKDGMRPVEVGLEALSAHRREVLGEICVTAQLLAEVLDETRVLTGLKYFEPILSLKKALLYDLRLL